jgi:hypothetical protein
MHRRGKEYIYISVPGIWKEASAEFSVTAEMILTYGIKFIIHLKNEIINVDIEKNTSVIPNIQDCFCHPFGDSLWTHWSRTPSKLLLFPFRSFAPLPALGPFLKLPGSCVQ